MKTSAAKQQVVTILKTNLAQTIQSTRTSLVEEVTNVLSIVEEAENEIQGMDPVDVEILLTEVTVQLRACVTHFEQNVSDLQGRDGLIKVMAMMVNEGVEEKAKRKEFRAAQKERKAQEKAVRSARAQERREASAARKAAKAAAAKKTPKKKGSGRKARS